MTIPEDIRTWALMLPESVEADHHGFPSFRVGGKIFCTLRVDRSRMMVKLKPEHQNNFVDAHPGAIEPVPGYWGRKGSTHVEYVNLSTALVQTLIELAWSGVAPRRLTASR